MLFDTLFILLAIAPWSRLNSCLKNKFKKIIKYDVHTPNVYFMSPNSK